jgi:hypothetical protein
MTIALIGYRGAGKTTVARLLARRLGWEAIDADDLLEARAGRTIQQIFAEQGEPWFRDWESAILAELVRRPRAILALGGGVVLREANRLLLPRPSVSTSEFRTMRRPPIADHSLPPRADWKRFSGCWPSVCRSTNNWPTIGWRFATRLPSRLPRRFMCGSPCPESTPAQCMRCELAPILPGTLSRGGSAP